MTVKTRKKQHILGITLICYHTEMDVRTIHTYAISFNFNNILIQKRTQFRVTIRRKRRRTQARRHASFLLFSFLAFLLQYHVLWLWCHIETCCSDFAGSSGMLFMQYSGQCDFTFFWCFFKGISLLGSQKCCRFKKFRV